MPTSFGRQEADWISHLSLSGFNAMKGFNQKVVYAEDISYGKERQRGQSLEGLADILNF